MDGHVSQDMKKQIKMEPPSPETPWASDPEGSAWWPASPCPSRPGGDTGASWDAATGPLPEGNALQAFVGDSQAPMTCHLLLEDICANTSPASGQLFLQKLWEVVNSQHFQSIWWGDDGNCIVTAKELFQTEVLGRRGHHKIFETESMRGFILQLNLHGFCKMERDSIISISIEELQALAAAGPALGKLLFYHNPLFNRDDPNLLTMFTQSAGARKRAPAAPPLGPDMEEDRPRRQCPEAQPAVGAAQEDNDTRTSATTSSTPTELWAGTTAPRGSASPPPPKRHCSHSPAGTQEAAPDPATASPPPVTPPAPANSPRTPARGFSSSP
ncbi:uncharacterized protein LOC141954493 [Strix uralensis]|uniref:uncharacterized protein LOC141954493 n=1 Tax=Strix uralensis TaxID=36305 RepID=UPI003DA71C69